MLRLDCLNHSAGELINVSTTGLIDFSFSQPKGQARMSTSDLDIVGVSSDAGLMDASRNASSSLETGIAWVDFVVCE